jgi:hypothetical protein
MGLDTKTYLLTDRQSQCDFDFDLNKSHPYLFIKGGTTKEEKKTKVLTLNKYSIWPWVPAGLDAKSDRTGWLPAVSYCSALNKFQFLSDRVQF